MPISLPPAADGPVQINDFLSTYKTEERTRNARHRQQAADDDDEAESEDDLADDVNDMNMGGPGEQRSKIKYMKLLRKVANRQTTEVVIDLSDLKRVSLKAGVGLTSSSLRILPYSTISLTTRVDTSRSFAKPLTRFCPSPMWSWSTLLGTCWISL